MEQSKFWAILQSSLVVYITEKFFGGLILLYFKFTDHRIVVFYTENTQIIPDIVQSVIFFITHLPSYRLSQTIFKMFDQTCEYKIIQKRTNIISGVKHAKIHLQAIAGYEFIRRKVWKFQILQLKNNDFRPV